MYQSLLTRRYLTSKIMPWLATLSVAVCVMLTLVVWSIMGGFLDTFLKIGRQIEGDVTIRWPTAGFGHYEDLVSRLEADSLVAAAAPVINTFGMLSLPDDRTSSVLIVGVDKRYANVTSFADALWWRPVQEANRKDVLREDPRLDPNWPSRTENNLRNVGMVDGNPVMAPPRGSYRSWEETYQDGLRLMEPDVRTGELRPAAVLGIEVGGFAARQPGIWYKSPALVAARRPDGGIVWQGAYMPAKDVTITVLPLDAAGRGRDISTTTLKLPVANEYRTGLYQADKETVLIELSALQRMLKMDPGIKVDTKNFNPFAVEGEGDTERPVGAELTREVTPARVTGVLVKGKDDVPLELLHKRCQEIYKEFAAAHPGDVPSYEQMIGAKSISTWERNLAQFIGQVKRETVTILFVLLIISLVCTVLILAIFWAMVAEKTKDIGILRSVGCSRAGVAWIWLRYGLIIGMLGALIGLGLACALVWNINEIHEWIGTQFGISVWDPAVYYLPEIPSKVDPLKAFYVMSCAVMFSVIGALIPAIRAANMDPVRALRFE